MSMWDRFFRSKETPPVSLDDVSLRRTFGGAAQMLEHREIEPALVRARVADGCRDAGVSPMLPEDFDALTAALDEESWRRLAAAASALEDEEVCEALAKLSETRPLRDSIQFGFVEFAAQCGPLTVELMRQSRLRTEEFTRRFIASLGAGVQGESVKDSKARLERIDYSRLLAEAEKARASAEDRAAYLKRLLEEQEKKFAPRGKW